MKSYYITPHKNRECVRILSTKNSRISRIFYLFNDLINCCACFNMYTAAYEAKFSRFTIHSLRKCERKYSRTRRDLRFRRSVHEMSISVNAYSNGRWGFCGASQVEEERHINACA